MPKLHKLVLAWRPICPSLHSHLHHLSLALTELLNPVARACVTVCNSTPEFIAELDATSVHPDTVMLVADVVALYPSIPVGKGIDVVREVLLEHLGVDSANHSDAHLQGCRVSAILCLLRVLLVSNVFEYGGAYYLQLDGIAMGTPVACPYANIFMYGIERHCVRSMCAATTLRLYKRYIDDVFALVRGRAAAKALAADLNGLCPGIVFTFDIEETRAVMLDLVVYRGPRWFADIRAGHEVRRYDYKVFQKSFNLYQYIPSTSAHPPKVKESFIGGELRRYATNSSQPADYAASATVFVDRLEALSYSRRMVASKVIAANYNDRRAVIASASRLRTARPAVQPADQVKPRRVALKVPYAPIMERVGLRAHLGCLCHRHDLPGPPPRPDIPASCQCL